MNIKSILLSLAAAAMLVPCTVTAAAPKSHKKKKAKTEVAAPEQKPAPKKKVTPYDKLMKDVKVKATGETFSLYRTSKDKIYMELPKKFMGRKMLVGGTITAGSNPSYVNVGYKYNNPSWFQIDLVDSLVVLSAPGLNATSTDPGMQEALKRSYSPKILRRMAVAAMSKDSSAVIFDVTGLVNAAAPKGTNFAVAKSADEKTGWFGEMKAFRDNASIKVYANVDFTKSFLGFKGKVGSGSIEYTVSFLLLPEKPMPARIQDSRIGIFPVGPGEGDTKYDISSAEDGFRKYNLASRWRLELSDTSAWLGGKTVTVKNPIIWYIDNTFPENWKGAIRKGVLAWNRAFEAIGLADVMQVNDFPSAEEDPEFDPDNLKYSCIRYVPDATMNARGPSWKDPQTGEILNASVLVYNDVIKLINNWRFVQTAQVDEKVRAVKMPQDIIEESLVYVISHEIGHTLGLMHNMGASFAYPVESLRDPEFTARYGTTPSIMDYARFNYVAQPEDKNVKLVPPELGIYDYYAIKWLYTPVIGAGDIWEEYRAAEKIIDENAGNPMCRYGAQQVSGYASYGVYDPSARTEDLGNDPVKAGNYGIANLKYILPRMNGWIGDSDPEFRHRADLYTQLASQYNRYIGHVLAQVGGIYLHLSKAERPAVPVPAKVQRTALKWVLGQLRDSKWLNDTSVTAWLPLSTPVSNKICMNTARALASTVPENVMRASAVAGAKDVYTIKDYYDDLYSELFASSAAGRRLTAEEKTLQREILSSSSKEIRSALTKSLTEEEATAEDMDPNWCGWDDCCDSLGEGNKPYQSSVSIQTIDETDSYRIAFLNKVKNLSNSHRVSAPAQDRAHYEFLYAKCRSALER